MTESKHLSSADVTTDDVTSQCTNAPEPGKIVNCFVNTGLHWHLSKHKITNSICFIQITGDL